MIKLQNGLSKKLVGKVTPSDKKLFLEAVQKHNPDWDNWEDWISKDDFRKRIYRDFKE